MQELEAVSADGYNGSPIIPTGNPMTDGLGPAAWVERADTPDVTAHGTPKIVPMRSAPGYSVAKGDPEPRGLPVIGADGAVAGVITDIWVDRSEPQVRYYEVEIPSEGTRLLPIGFVQWPNLGLWGLNRVIVKSITSAQFVGVPQTKRDDQVTLREEDQIMGYYAGGHLWATPRRSEPLI